MVVFKFVFLVVMLIGERQLVLRTYLMIWEVRHHLIRVQNEKIGDLLKWIILALYFIQPLVKL